MPDETTREANKTVARNLIEAWNRRGETHLPEELVSPHMVRHFPQSVGRAARGDAPAADSALPRDAFPDQQFTEEMVIADEDHVFIAWELRATQRGAFFGRAATNRTVTVFGSDVIRLADGKIIEHWEYYPKARIHALAQLGLLNAETARQLENEGQLGRNRRTGQVSVG